MRGGGRAGGGGACSQALHRWPGCSLALLGHFLGHFLALSMRARALSDASGSPGALPGAGTPIIRRRFPGVLAQVPFSAGYRRHHSAQNAHSRRRLRPFYRTCAIRRGETEKGRATFRGNSFRGTYCSALDLVQIMARPRPPQQSHFLLSVVKSYASCPRCSETDISETAISDAKVRLLSDWRKNNMVFFQNSLFPGKNSALTDTDSRVCTSPLSPTAA